MVLFMGASVKMGKLKSFSLVLVVFLAKVDLLPIYFFWLVLAWQDP